MVTPRAVWPLLLGRPIIEVVLPAKKGSRQSTRALIADTGGGTDQAYFEMIMDENDCQSYGGQRLKSVAITGSFSGSYSVYAVRVQIPLLAFNHRIRVAGVPRLPIGFDGIACFRFLNRFTYGNFGDRSQFGIEI